MTTATRTTADVLRDMRELLAEPERWTQGVMARDPERVSISPDSEYAIRWCIVGAGTRIAGPFAEWYDAIHELLPGSACIGDWNDAPERTHAEVIALLDRAIEVAEASS